MSKRDERRPHGRDEVMAAVRAATVELLAEHSPRDISVRDVAQRAGVNHALVHRHFGTKDELFRTVIAEQSAVVGAAVRPDDITAALHQLRARSQYWRILARAVLDAPQVLEPARTNAAAAVLGLLSGPAEPDATTRTTAAVAGSLALGWIVFGEHLSSVLDIDDDALDAAVADAVRLILGRGAS